MIERVFFLKFYIFFIEYICILVIFVDFYLIYFEGWGGVFVVEMKKNLYLF